MNYVSLKELSINQNELTRTQDELEQFIKKYSVNHIEIKFIVNGYKLISESNNEIDLNSFSLTKVFPIESDRKIEIAWKKVDILTTLLAYIFNSPKNHSIRISAGNGMLIPRIMNNNYENYPINIMTAQFNVEKDWHLKHETFLKYSDYFIDYETDALPIFWYGKGLLSNDSTSAFLNFYRCIEVLSRSYFTEINSHVRNIIESELNIKDKNSEIQDIYKSVSIPKRFMFPLFLEEKGIQKQTYQNWRDFRNKLPHGESLEFNNELINELVNLKNNTKTILDAKIADYFPSISSDIRGR